MDDLALATAIFLGGLVSGFSGFAFSAATRAILLHFLPPMQAIPLMVCSIGTQATSVLLVRKYVVWSDMRPLLFGGIVGLPIAIDSSPPHLPPVPTARGWTFCRSCRVRGPFKVQGWFVYLGHDDVDQIHSAH